MKCLVGLMGWARRGRHDHVPPGRGWRKHSMIGDQVHTRTRDQRSQALDEGEWVEHEVGRAITPSSAQLVDHLAIRGEREALGGDRASCDIAAEVLEADPVVGPDVDLGVQGEAVLVCAERAGSPVEAVLGSRVRGALPLRR